MSLTFEIIGGVLLLFIWSELRDIARALKTTAKLMHKIDERMR